MLCLRATSGLPIDVDLELDRILLDNVELQFQDCYYVPLQEIVPTLLNKSLRYPEEVYTQHRSVKRKTHAQGWPTNFDYDIYYLPSGLLGIEYSKTHVFKADSKVAPVASFVQVLTGSLTVLLQKNQPKDDPYQFAENVEHSQLVNLEEGDKLAIPADYYYTFINTGELPAVFSRIVKNDHKVEAQEMAKKNGLAYYLISKNARQEIVTNPRYKILKDLQHNASSVVNDVLDYQPDRSQPLYEEVLADINRFTQILV